MYGERRFDPLRFRHSVGLFFVGIRPEFHAIRSEFLSLRLGFPVSPLHPKVQVLPRDKPCGKTPPRATRSGALLPFLLEAGPRRKDTNSRRRGRRVGRYVGGHLCSSAAENSWATRPYGREESYRRVGKRTATILRSVLRQYFF